MVSAIFTELQTIVSSFVDMLISLFESAVKIFYTAPSGSNTTGSLTVVGILALIGLGTGLVMWAFKYIKSLIRVKTK